MVKSAKETMKEGKPDGFWKNYYLNGNIKLPAIEKISNQIVSGIFMMKKAEFPDR